MKKNVFAILFVLIILGLIINQFGNDYRAYYIEESEGYQKANLYKFFSRHYVSVNKTEDSIFIKSYDKSSPLRYWIGVVTPKKIVYFLRSDHTNSDVFSFYIKEPHRISSIELSSILSPSNTSNIHIFSVARDSIETIDTEFEFPSYMESNKRVEYFRNLLQGDKEISYLEIKDTNKKGKLAIQNYSAEIRRRFVF